MKKYKFSIILAFLFIISLVSVGFAIEYSIDDPEYSYDDTGDIYGTEILLDGEWYLRPGLVTYPFVSGPDEYAVRSTLQEDSPIDTVILFHGPPGGGPFIETDPAAITNGNIDTSFIPDEGTFNYCEPQWEYAFYLLGYQDDTVIDIDERHYADGSGRGDPYVFNILNPNMNQPPVVDPGGPYIVDRFYNEYVTLDASGSSDPEGSSLTYEWDVYVTWEEFQPLAFVQDDEFDDGTGPNPDIYFDESGYYHVRLKVTDECGEENIEETYLMVYDPSIVVVPQDNHIAGLNWHKDMQLTLYLDGVEIDTQSVQGPEEGLPEKDGYQAGFQLNEYGIEAILPGTLVTMVGVVEDTTVTREHVVRDFWFDVDYENDIVFGGSEIRLPSPPEENYVRVRVEDPYHHEIVAWVDSNGDWSADFSDVDGDGVPAGEDPDDIDLTEETRIVVLQQNYNDSSHTFRYVPEEGPPGSPTLTAHPNEDRVVGDGWSLGSSVTLIINDNEVDTKEVEEAEWDPEQTWMEFRLWEYDPPLDLMPGDLVVLTDGTTTKEHVVTELMVSDIDTESDTISGTTNFDFEVQLWVHPGVDGSFVSATPDSSGIWTANFSPFDLVSSDAGPAVQFDEDGDGTWVEWWLPNPHFTIQPDHGWAFGGDWPLNAEVTLVIDDDMEPGNGLIYTATEMTVPAEWNQDVGMVSFEFGEIAEQVQPGQYVSMTDGETTKDTIIYDMVFETLNPDTETASGFGPSYRPGHVHIESNGPYDYELPAEENDGSWTADFSGQMIDFTNVQDANVEFWDEDGDGTMAHLQLEPQFLGGEISPNPVPVGEPITITAEYLKGYYSIGTIEISFFQTDPPEWIALGVTVVDDQATGTITLTFDEPGVYPVGTRAFTTQGQESGGFLGLLVVYDGGISIGEGM